MTAPALPPETTEALATSMQALVVIRPEATPASLANALVQVAYGRLPLAYDAMDHWWRVSGVEARQALVFRLCAALRHVDAMSTQALLDPRWRAGVGVPLALATLAVNLRSRRKHRAINTLRAQASDWRVWRRWCKQHQQPSFNPSAWQLEQFLAHYAPRHKLSSISRWGSSLSAMHEAAGFSNPLLAPIVRDVWLTALKAPDPEKKSTDRRNVPVDQAEGLTREQLEQVLIACDSNSLIGARDAALLAVTYDLMGRRSEVVALNRDDIRIHEQKGIGIATIRRSKTDQIGAGKELLLRKDTCDRLLHWMSLAQISDDDVALFRSLRGFAGRGAAKPRNRLPAPELAKIIRRRVRGAKIFDVDVLGEPEVERRIARFSGHSLRVGSAQDMVAAGISDGDIMNNARWKSLATLLRYTAAQRAERSAMAKLAALQMDGGDHLPSPATPMLPPRVVRDDNPRSRGELAAPARHTTRIAMHLMVQSNFKYGRGAPKAVKAIEWLLEDHNCKGKNGRYRFDVVHEDDADLNAQVAELVDQIYRYPDAWGCFAELSLHIEGTDRCWRDHNERFDTPQEVEDDTWERPASNDDSEAEPTP